MPSIKLGELLVKANVLNEGQLKAALSEQHKWGGRLGDILVRMSVLTEDLLIRALSRQLGIPTVNLEAVQNIPPSAKAKLSGDKARELCVLPIQLRDDGKTLVVAMAEPQNLSQLDTLRAITGCRIMVHIAGRIAIARAFARLYEGEADLSDQESSFKVLDAQGRTVVKPLSELEADRPAPPPPAPPVKASPPRAAGADPSALLKSVEDAQRREVASLKAMVELLIEKGVFTREEYIAKVRR